MREFLSGGALGALVMLGITGGMHLQTVAGQTGRVPQFENDAVKAWRTVVQPNSATAMHRHDHPRVVVALTSGTMTLRDPAGQIEQHAWEAGKAYWLPAMPPGAMHADVNATDKPLDVMVIELEKEK